MKGEMKKMWKRILTLFLGIIISLGSINAVFADNINDIDKSSAYSKAAISALYSKGIISGDEKGNFYPKKNVTRGEALKIILNSAGIDTSDIPGTQTFKDVSPKHWAYKYVETAYKLGIASGISKDTFGINQNCTREQAAVFYTKALGITMDKTSNITITGGQDNISDYKEISAWAKPYALFMTKTGMIKGDPEGKFMPKQLINKEQLAVIADRYMGSGAKLNEFVNMYYTAQNTQAVKIDNLLYFASSRPYSDFALLGYIDENGKEANISAVDYKNWPGFENIKIELWGADLTQAFAPVVDNGRCDYATTGKKTQYEEPFIYANESIRSHNALEMVYRFTYDSPYGPISYKVRKAARLGKNNTGIVAAVATGPSKISLYVPRNVSIDSYQDKNMYHVSDAKGNNLEVKQVDYYNNTIHLNLAKPMADGSTIIVEVDGLKDTFKGEILLEKFSSSFVYINRSFSGIQ